MLKTTAFYLLTSIIPFSCASFLGMKSEPMQGQNFPRPQLIDSILNVYYNEFDTTLAEISFNDDLDFNFDGTKDLVIEVDNSNIGIGSNILWDVYYFNPVTVQFNLAYPLNKIPNPKFDSNKRFIYTLYLGNNLVSMAHSYSWTDNKWVKFKSFQVIPSQDSSHISQGIQKDSLGNVINTFYIDQNYPPDSLFR